MHVLLLVILTALADLSQRLVLSKIPVAKEPDVNLKTVALIQENASYIQVRVLAKKSTEAAMLVNVPWVHSVIPAVNPTAVM